MPKLSAVELFYRKVSDTKSVRTKSLVQNQINQSTNTVNDSHSKKDLEFLLDENKIEIAIGILRKPPGERSLEDIRRLTQATQSMKFFADLSNVHGRSIHKLCCEQMTYEMHCENITIFNKGDWGDKFYLIIDGIVGVSLELPVEELTEQEVIEENSSAECNNDLSSSDLTPSVLDEKHINNVTVPVVNEKNTNNTTNSTTNNTTNYCINFPIKKYAFSEVSILKSGECFGDYALMDDCPRTATIKSKTILHLGVLTRSSFMKILAKVKQKEVDSKLNFLLSVNIFNKFTRRSLATMLYHFSVKKYQRNQIIYKEYDDPSALFIVRKGNVKLTKFFSIKPDADKKDGRIELNELKQYTRKKAFDLAILGEEQIFGEEDVILDRKRVTSVVCESAEAIIFSIPRRDFLKRISLTKDDSFSEFISKQCRQKAAWIDGKIKEIEEVLDAQKKLIVGNHFQRKYLIEQKKEIRVKKRENNEKNDQLMVEQTREIRNNDNLYLRKKPMHQILDNTILNFMGKLEKVDPSEVTCGGKTIEEFELYKKSPLPKKNTRSNFETSTMQANNHEGSLNSNSKALDVPVPAIQIKQISAMKNEGNRNSLGSESCLGKRRVSLNSINLPSQIEDTRIITSARRPTTSELRETKESFNKFSSTDFKGVSRPKSADYHGISKSNPNKMNRISSNSPLKQGSSSEKQINQFSKFKAVKTTEESCSLIKSRNKVFQLIKERNNLEHIDFRTLIVQNSEIPLFLLIRKGFKLEDLKKNSDTMMRISANKKDKSGNRSARSNEPSPRRSPTPVSSKVQGGFFKNKSVCTNSSTNIKKTKYYKRELERYVQKQMDSDIEVTRRSNTSSFLYSVTHVTS